MTGRNVLSAVMIIIATLLGLYLVWVLRSTVLLLLGAVIIASAIRPYVAWLQKKGLPAVVAVLLIYLLVFGGLAALLFWVVPPLVMFAVDLFTSGALTDRLTSLLTSLAWAGWDRFRVIIPVFQVPEYLNRLMAETTEDIQRQAWPIAQSTLIGASQFLLMLFIIFYWLTAREKMLSIILLLSPAKNRPTVNAVWTDIENRLGAYVRGMAFLMLIIGGCAYVGLLLLRIPYALPLAVIAGVMEAVPMIGAFLGAVPAVLVALTVSPTAALLTVIFFVILQSLEGNVIVPRVMSSQVGLNALVIVIAMVAGATLNGIIGMLLAIPIAAALQVIFQHVWVKPAIEALPLPAVQAAEDGTQTAEQVTNSLNAVPVADSDGDGLAETVVRPASTVEAAEEQGEREAAAREGRPLPDLSDEEAVAESDGKEAREAVIAADAVGLPTPDEILAVHVAQPGLPAAGGANGDSADRAQSATAQEDAKAQETAATTTDELPTPEAILAATAALTTEGDVTVTKTQTVETSVTIDAPGDKAGRSGAEQETGEQAAETTANSPAPETNAAKDHSAGPATA